MEPVVTNETVTRTVGVMKRVQKQITLENGQIQIINSFYFMGIKIREKSEIRKQAIVDVVRETFYG